jgi:hypothetical protein
VGRGRSCLCNDALRDLRPCCVFFQWTLGPSRVLLRPAGVSNSAKEGWKGILSPLCHLLGGSLSHWSWAPTGHPSWCHLLPTPCLLGQGPSQELEICGWPASCLDRRRPCNDRLFHIPRKNKPICKNPEV